MFFAKFLIEHTPKSHLENHPSHHLMFFSRNIGPLVSIKQDHAKLKIAVLFILLQVESKIRNSHLEKGP